MNRYFWKLVNIDIHEIHVDISTFSLLNTLRQYLLCVQKLI